MSWTCFWHCKHHSQTKSFQFAHVLTSQTSVFEMKNSFNLDMLCLCKRHSEQWRDVGVVETHSTKIVLWIFCFCKLFPEIKLHKGCLLEVAACFGYICFPKRFWAKYAGFNFRNGISSKFFSWNKIASWWFLDFARILGPDSFALNVKLFSILGWSAN